MLVHHMTNIHIHIYDQFTAAISPLAHLWIVGETCKLHACKLRNDLNKGPSMLPTEPPWGDEHFWHFSLCNPLRSTSPIVQKNMTIAYFSNDFKLEISPCCTLISGGRNTQTLDKLCRKVDLGGQS